MSYTREEIKAMRFEVLNDYIEPKGFYKEDNYKGLPSSTQEEKEARLAFVLNDEFLIVMGNGSTRNGAEKNRLSDVRKLTPELVETILKESLGFLVGSKGSLQSIYAGHKKRNDAKNPDVIKLNSWKSDIARIFSDHQYCFKCKTPGYDDVKLVTDHVKPHNSFESRELAFDRRNGQLLCHACNSMKANTHADYRTPEHFKAIESFIKAQTLLDAVEEAE